MQNVTLYTDGAARGNPDGPGGYGAVLQFVDSQGNLHEREFSAGYIRTTNNRMELMAVIAGLEALTKPCRVEIVSDSKVMTKKLLKINFCKNSLLSSSIGTFICLTKIILSYHPLEDRKSKQILSYNLHSHRYHQVFRQ